MDTGEHTAAALSGLTDDQLNRLLKHARMAERGGRLGEARELVAMVISELNAAGHRPLQPLRWIARLEAELGEYASARRWLDVGRDLAVDAGQATATFQIDLALARIAIAASDFPEAEQLLAQIPLTIGPRPPTEASAERVTRWVTALNLTGDPRNDSALRSEAALTIMDLWRAAGRHRSALALLSATRAAVFAANPRAQIANVDLLEAELLFAVGEIERASEQMLAIGSRMEGTDIARHAIMALRIALRAGRLAEARRVAARPLQTKDPVLLGQAAVARIALLNELNMYEDAHAEASAAATALANQAPTSSVRQMLDRAIAATELRARTAVASWELPWVPEQARQHMEYYEELADPQLITQRRGHDEWIPLLDAVLVALEAEDHPAARAARDRLVEVTRSVESRYVAARVRVACALVDYYDSGPTAATLRDLLAAADELRATGARLAELQAVRFAAWSAGRLGRTTDHRELANRALAITDGIAGELDHGDRIAFLMNKWSGRDDVVMLRLDHVLRTAPPRGRHRDRIVCALFREVEQLTCWPVDEALGAVRARGLASEATSDQVAQWVADHRGDPPPGGFALRSPWSLWRFPMRTVALHYHVLPDRIILFRIAWRRIDVFVLPVSRATLDRQLASCLKSIQDDEDPGGVDEVLTWLARVLGIAEAMTAFPRARRLVVIGHDVIANVPFAAMRIGGGRLCERVAISQSDRLSRLQRRGPRTIDRFVGLGLAHYEPALTDLPGAEREVAAIAELLGDDCTTQQLGEAATRRAFIEAIGSATHVHVAAHGELVLGDPAASGIILRDGRIALRELGGMHPRDLRVVALSTCWAAEAATLPGRERVCLPTALLDIGARAVIASLWEVGDDAGGRFMLDVYRNMHKLGPAAALTAAQVIRASRGEPLRDWAGFLCYGSD